MIHHIGVCSWSLQAPYLPRLVERVAATRVRNVQLALDAVRTGQLPLRGVRSALAAIHVQIRSGMMAMEGEDYSTLASIRRTGGVVPDETWDRNLAAARENAEIADYLDIPMVTLHAGFIPHDPIHPDYSKLVDRLGQLMDVFFEANVLVALETGQESAETLLALFEELPDLAVNFDPANMILYDTGDPVEALELLLPRVVQVHIKDAVRTSTPGEWGEEVVVGDGEVDWEAFLALLRHAPHPIDLMIEREAGDTRIMDVRHAVDLLRGHGVT